MTDDEARKILDFLAKKLGYEYMWVFSGVLYMRSKTRMSMVFQGKYDTLGDYHTVCGNSYVDALVNILQDCYTQKEDYLSEGYLRMKIPSSLEEIKIMMDLEDEICMDD